MDSCAGKLIRSNHRLMGTYVQLMPRMVQRRMEEMESKATEAAALLSATEAPSLSQSPVTSSPLPPLTLSAADVGPDARGSSSKLTGSDAPVELSAASEGKLSAASVLNHAGSGPQPPVAGPQIEFEGPVPAFVPSQPTSISTVASPPVSKSAESLSHRERATEIPPASGQ